MMFHSGSLHRPSNCNQHPQHYP